MFGSRTLTDERVERECDKFTAGKNYRFIITALDPAGVCDRVKHWVKRARRGFVLIEISLDQSRARGMHEARSIVAMKLADHMLAIWDGASRGTAGEIKLAEKMGVPTTVITLRPKPAPATTLDYELPAGVSDMLTDLAGGRPAGGKTRERGGRRK